MKAEMINIIIDALETKNIEEFEEFIKTDSLMHCFDYVKLLMFHAFTYNRPDCLNLLFKHLCFDYASTYAKSNNTSYLMDIILSAAYSPDKREIFSVILKHTENINKQDNYGCTALYYAVQRSWAYEDGTNHLSLIKLLLDHGADPYLKTNYDDEDSPFSIAIIRKLHNIVELFLERKNSSFHDMEIDLLRIAAIKCNDYDMVELLLPHIKYMNDISKGKTILEHIESCIPPNYDMIELVNTYLLEKGSQNLSLSFGKR